MCSIVGKIVLGLLILGASTLAIFGIGYGILLILSPLIPPYMDLGQRVVSAVLIILCLLIVVGVAVVVGDSVCNGFHKKDVEETL